MITKEKVKQGIEKGLIRFELDPNMDHGTVCRIGDTWFYFGGVTAEEEDPEEYLANVSQEALVDEIFSVLNDFTSSGPEYFDEYTYYDAFLEENLKKLMPKRNKYQIEAGTCKIRITGDRNAPLVKAILDLPDPQREELKKVLDVVPNDGYALCIYEMRE